MSPAPLTRRAAASFISELEDAVSRGSAERREKALRYATNLLIAGRYTDDEIWLFGEVIEKLARELEVTSRARLAHQLAFSTNAPTKVINNLALDNSIEVAAPVLRHSPQLDTKILIDIARSKSQQHLLAISLRKYISEDVTDVLVMRGDEAVAISVAANHGARLSNCSFMNLIERSKDDSILCETLCGRRDIPRHLFQQLIARASEEVNRRLRSEHPNLIEEIDDVVADTTSEMHRKFGPASATYFAAKKAVLAKHQHDNIKENDIYNYAISHKFDEAMIGLSVLCRLPVNIIERALTDKTGQTIVILTKAMGFAWETTMALLFLSAEDYKLYEQHLDDLRKEYTRLNAETAKEVIVLYKKRRGRRTRKLNA